MKKIDWLSLDGKSLRVFITVMEVGTITGAADRLGITQSAVSHTVEKLRKILGDPLFIRAGRTISPTVYAQQIVEKVEKILDQLQGLVQTASFSPAESEIDLVIAANDFQSSLLMPLFYEQVKKKLKRFTLKVISPHLPSAELLRDKKCDLAIVGFSPDAPDIIQRALFTMNTVVFYDPAVRKAPKNMRDYLNSKHIGLSFLQNFKGGIDDYLITRGQQRQVDIFAPNFSSVATYLKGTDMLATLPSLMALTEMRGFACSPLPFQFLSGKMNMIWHQSYQEDEPHKWLRKQMVKVVNAILEKES
ncbi:MAG: LysR family transcriptional regulator [Desulfobacter sp.]|nr:LysR family transcriptional regulator [Desulfobacter sp.]WDP85298.1 MAG: LysR family transcriptional regulator [Desulfobacter sp.]